MARVSTIVLSVLVALLVITQTGTFYHFTNIQGETQSQLGKLNSQLKSTELALQGTITAVSNTLDQRTTQLNTSIQDTSTSLSGQISQTRNQLSERQDTIEKTQQTFTQQLGDLEQSQEETRDDLEESIRNLQLNNNDFVSVIQDATPAVVSVLTNTGQGSGVILTSDGLVMTNYHVIDGASAVGVLTSDGEQHGVTLIGAVESRDIAVLRINSNKAFHSLDFANSIVKGEPVIAIGNPGGLGFSVTEGIVSATPAERIVNGLSFVQISAPINPGNSGGPVLNAQGDIVGIATLKLDGFDSVGFAVPYTDAEDILQQAETFIAGKN